MNTNKITQSISAEYRNQAQTVENALFELAQDDDDSLLGTLKWAWEEIKDSIVYAIKGDD